MSAAIATLGDFVRYADNYKYSKESYEIEKACSEITLMEMYIESQNYIMESGGAVSQSLFPITEGAEISVLEEGVKERVKAVGAKLKSMGKTVINALISIWEKIIQFFKSIPENLKKLGGLPGIRTILSKFRKKKGVTEEAVADVEEAVRMLEAAGAENSSLNGEMPVGTDELAEIIEATVKAEDETTDTNEDATEKKVNSIKEKLDKIGSGIKEKATLTLQNIQKQLATLKKLLSRSDEGKAARQSLRGKITGFFKDIWNKIQALASRVVKFVSDQIKKLQTAIGKLKKAKTAVESESASEDTGGGEPAGAEA